MKFLAFLILPFLISCGKQESGPVPTAIIEKSKDPVCNMWVEKTLVAIKAEFDNAEYYFCAEECKQQFLAKPTKYVTPCECSKIKHDCACPHCRNTKVPCDCR